MMNTRSGGGAAAGAVSLFLETCREAEYRAVEVAKDGDQRSRGRPWRGRAGHVRGRRKVTHRQGRRRTTDRWQMVERRLRRHLGREAGGCRMPLVFGVTDGCTATGACAGQTQKCRAAEGTARLGRAKGAGTGAALPKAGGCRHHIMHLTVAPAPLAARPERRPRAPGRAWSEGPLCAAADSPGN